MSIFSNVAGRKTRRSKFNLSHERKMSLNMGELVPILCQEILPGDKFQVQSEVLMRLAPMISPLMHRVNVYTHYFFVPNRIVWDQWSDFITGGPQGDLTPAMPKLNILESNRADFAKGTLADYFGLPVTDADGGAWAKNSAISALPFRAYTEIFNEYYRDQNLSDKIDITDATEVAKIRQRAWEKDYFTSALPWAQRGQNSSVPADPTYKDKAIIMDQFGDPISTSGTTLHANPQSELSVTNTGDGHGIDNLESIDVDINDLRKSVRLQEWLERSARGGARYIEQILSHFGVRSSDSRLQRPEFLGGGKNPVVISEVLQTGATGADTSIISTPQGNMAGHGISVGRTNGFRKSFEEHGFVIGIMSVLPKTAYQQGIDRFWKRDDKFDYYWPEFAQLGEQELLDEELYFKYTEADPGNGTFGYQSRYAEYKYGKSSVHGDFRDELNFWHMGRIFDNKPVLNESFITSDPDPRIFAVTELEEDKLYCQVYNSISALRPMPYFNNPTL